jgi:ribosomal protein S21|tara:strand:- start:220 stop:498 length:279 start_codon:yes stop_codon:yes gene_type:complete
MDKRLKIWQSYIPGSANGVAVVNSKFTDKNGNERSVPDIGFALRLWKETLKESGKMDELKSRTHYIKKSARRRVARDNAIYYLQEARRREEM